MQIDPNMQYGHQFYAVPIMPFYAVPIMPGQLPSSYGGFVSQPMPQTTGGKPAAASAESATSKSSKKRKRRLQPQVIKRATVTERRNLLRNPRRAPKPSKTTQPGSSTRLNSAGTGR